MLYDKDIREPLFDFLEEEYGKVRILEEKRTGRARADVVMITEDALFGIEIKSDADTYVRLAGQVRNYNLYYDYNYVVVGSSHGKHIEEHVPDFWGIITVEETEGGADFYLLRKPEEPKKITDAKWKRKLGILWRPELAHLQEINHMARYKEKSKKFVIEKILEKVPRELLQKQICEELFERDYTTIEDTIRTYKEEQNKNKKGKSSNSNK